MKKAGRQQALASLPIQMRPAFSHCREDIQELSILHLQLDFLIPEKFLPRTFWPGCFKSITGRQRQTEIRQELTTIIKVLQFITKLLQNTAKPEANTLILTGDLKAITHGAHFSIVSSKNIYPLVTYLNNQTNFFMCTCTNDVMNQDTQHNATYCTQYKHLDDQNWFYFTKVFMHNNSLFQNYIKYIYKKDNITNTYGQQ